jgi:ABC-2 type transport system ATP-binding protein
MNRALGPIPLDAAVCLQSVHKVFPSRIGVMKWLSRSEPIAALNDISLCTSQGEVVALMGSNGSGKSTLLKVIAGTLLPNRGRVTVLGFDTARQNLEARRPVGLAVAQERSFYPRLSAEENLAFFAAMENVPRRRRRGRIEWVLEQCGLTDVRRRLVHQLSSGMYQRLGIARALLKEPAVLLLDEPTRSADPETAMSIRQLVRTLAEGGMTVLLATHSFEEAASLADSAVLLSHGRIAAQARDAHAGQLRSVFAQSIPLVHEVEEEAWEACIS